MTEGGSLIVDSEEAFCTGNENMNYHTFNMDDQLSLSEEDTYRVRPPARTTGSRRSSPRTPRTSNAGSRSFAKTLPPADKTLKEKAMALRPLYGLNDEDYDSILAELVEERRNNAATHKFSCSARINEAIRHVEACQIRQKKYVMQMEACQEYDEQVAQFKQSLRDFDDETDRLEKELAEKLTQQRQNLIKNHQAEIQAHTEKWTSASMKRRYNHASFGLRNNKKQFRLLMLECRFKEAETLKEVIDKTESAEKADAIKLMQADYDASHKALRARQLNDLRNMDQKAEISLNQLRQKRGWVRQSFMNKKRKIEQRAAQIADPDKLWNLAQLHRKEEIASGAMSVPNTAARLNEEDINDREEAVLELPPLKVSARLSSRGSRY